MSARGKTIACLSGIAALILPGLLLLVITEPQPHVGLFSLVHGTMFGQTSLAAAWCVLGPFSLARRLPLAGTWLAAIILCFGWNNAYASSAYELNLLLTFAVVLPSQGPLVAVPMSFVAAWFGLRIDASQSDRERRDHQIGIREALLLTGIVAVVLGAARFRSGGLHEAEILWGDAGVFAFLVVANTILALPLVGAALVRWEWQATLVSSLLIVGIVSGLEIAAAFLLAPRAGAIDEDTCWAIILLNIVQGTWIVAVLSLLRLGAFVLTSHRARSG
jgi:hypothetical protein